ncbi:MAG: PAS domain-containing protein [Proteobacteria bacterium]|nr:PAS domain-containing protein [Pseudomonadota bacterium]
MTEINNTGKAETKHRIRHPRLKGLHPFFTQWLILGMTLLALGGAMSYLLAEQHSLIEAQERVQLANLAKVLDVNLGHQLDATNRALVGIRDDLPYWKTKHDGKSQTNRQLRVISDAMPGIRTLQILNAAGIVMASNREEMIGHNFAGRDYFKTPHQHPDPAMLYVSPPFRTALGVFGMNLVRVVTGPKGKFAGIVTATLDPEYFTVLLESVLYTPDMRASVNHGDGKVFLIVPDRKDVEGIDLAKPGSFYTRHVESKQAASLFKGLVVATGDERMIAMRTVKSDKFIADTSLMVAVSRDLYAIFATWRHAAFVQGVLFGVLALAAVLGLYSYQRREQKFADTETGYVAKLQENETELQAIFDTVGTGILIIDKNTQIIIEANQTTIEMTGLPKERIIGQICHSLVCPAQAGKCPVKDLGQSVDHSERKLLYADGRQKDILKTVYPITIKGRDCYLESFIDISDRLLAEAALRTQNKTFSQVLNGLDALVYVVDMKTYEIVFINAYGQHIWGDIKGKICWQTIQTGHANPCKFCTNSQLVGPDGNPTEGVVWEFQNTVTKRWYDCRDRAIYWPDGRIVRMEIATDVTARKLAEDQIKSLLSEKEILLKEVHHRIKNNMNVIVSLLSLHADTLHDPSAIAALEDSGSRVRSMMILYDKLYRSADFREISTKEYLTSLIEEIVNNFPNRGLITIKKQIDDIILDAKTLSPVGIILNELLTNIMKHAFVGRDKGAIGVSLSIKDNHATLIVQDNGIGIPEPNDMATSTGFGMQLVGILTEQLEGNMTIERENGTKFILEFEV